MGDGGVVRLGCGIGGDCVCGCVGSDCCGNCDCDGDGDDVCGDGAVAFVGVGGGVRDDGVVTHVGDCSYTHTAPRNSQAPDNLNVESVSHGDDTTVSHAHKMRCT